MFLEKFSENLSFAFAYQKTPARGVLVYPLGLEPKLDGVGGRNVIQLHYEYVFSFAYKKSLFSFFSKKHLYFTIFYFLFASVYGILFLNSVKIFTENSTGSVLYVENSRNRYERWRR